MTLDSRDRERESSSSGVEEELRRLLAVIDERDDNEAFDCTREVLRRLPSLLDRLEALKAENRSLDQAWINAEAEIELLTAARDARTEAMRLARAIIADAIKDTNMEVSEPLLAKIDAALSTPATEEKGR
jgi:hypothetical protein